MSLLRYPTSPFFDCRTNNPDVSVNTIFTILARSCQSTIAYFQVGRVLHSMPLLLAVLGSNRNQKKLKIKVEILNAMQQQQSFIVGECQSLYLPIGFAFSTDQNRSKYLSREARIHSDHVRLLFNLTQRG